jgi:glycosyltransferase involved in cell wall biosynthesis
MESIRPLLLTFADTDGAGTATRRIHNGLREIGLNSEMLVRRKLTDDHTIHGPNNLFSKAVAKLRPYLDSLPLLMYGTPPEFSISWQPDRLHRRVAKLDPDVVHLNWVGNGFMSPESIRKFDRPIVWRLPDMWPLTGGCHYAKGCTGYQSHCGNCPQLESSRSWDPSRITLDRKERAVNAADVTVVATTSWLAESARESTIFQDCRVETIPNGLNTDVFKPFEASIGREMFGLPKDVPLVLFGSVGPLSNPRKGYDLLEKALNRFAEMEDIAPNLVIFGTKEPENPPSLGFPTHYTGYLHDEESLALLYAAADVMVVPSRYEGFGQTVTEALSCGTPVVAFDSTGPKDIIKHKETGYLASAYEPADLAAGIRWILEDTKRRTRLGQNARRAAVDEYHYTTIAEQYLTLFKQVVG